MRKSAQERFRRADTLMGILKDAGVDPPTEQGGPKPSVDSPSSGTDNAEGSIWKEMGAVFTSGERRREFIDFIRKGLRR